MTKDRIWILVARMLSGETTATEQEELNQLKSQFTQEEKKVERVVNWWGMDAGADPEFLEATYLAHLERMKNKGVYPGAETPVLETNVDTLLETGSKQFFSLRRLLAAACIMALFFAGWLLVKPIQTSPVAANSQKAAEVSTRNGAKSKILLPDGSNVLLNSGSKITWSKDFDNNLLREVHLTGEAFFDVVKDAKRPFIIHTARIDVKVLGTRFNVKAYEEDQTTETSLIKGSVEVFLKNKPELKYLLKPNQKLVLQNELPAKAAQSRANVALPTPAARLIEIRPLTYLQGTETDIESSWTKNILSFEDEAFKEVAKKMERWFDVSFEFKNKHWEQQYLNGSFEKESLEQAMKALQYSTGFNYTIKGRHIVIF